MMMYKENEIHIKERYHRFFRHFDLGVKDLRWLPGGSQTRLWIGKTNVLVDNETGISRNLKGLGATEIANAVRKKVSPGSRPLFGFSRPNPAENEIPIANP
jgi:hypothetical protein